MRGEWISLAGLRVDGRRPEELRRLRCRLGHYPGADGSALLEQVRQPAQVGQNEEACQRAGRTERRLCVCGLQGQTVVLAVVDGPKEVARRSDAEHDKVGEHHQQQQQHTATLSSQPASQPAGAR